MGALVIAAHIAIEIPISFQFFRDDRVGAKNTPAGKIMPQAFEDNYVGGEEQEGTGKIIARFRHGVEVLPGDCQRHDLGLAAAGGHFDAIAGEVIILEQAQVFVGAGIIFDQCFMAANASHFVQENERLDGFALGFMIGKLVTIGQAMVRPKPEIQQEPCGGTDTFIIFNAPFLHGAPDRRYAGCCFGGWLNEGGLAF